MYDYLVVGAGLFGSVFAHEMRERGKRVLVIDRRDHIGGNVYTKDMGGIPVHVYGAHIFHTNDQEVWEYVNRFVRFNRFTNAPLARYKDKLYSLPFNMNTFYQMWGVTAPEEAKAIIDRQRKEITGEPQNLEEQAISLVGRDIYEKLIKGYTEKQWGRPCKELPAFIIRRLPVRFTFDSNYFNDAYQGIPTESYTNLIEKLLDGVQIWLNAGYETVKDKVKAKQVLYTGPIDQYFGYRLGKLEYRSLRFETQDMPIPNYQGNAVINETSADVPYTRTIEHKHFAYDRTDVQSTSHTVITREYPQAWQPGLEPYYPVNDERNNALYEQYKELAHRDANVIFGGRLGQYKYLDMDDTVRAALDCARSLE